MSTRLDVARRKLGESLGGYAVITALSGTSGTFAYTAPMVSSVMPDDAFDYQWVYAPASGLPRLRRVASAGLDGAVGTVTLDGTMGTAIAGGDTIELSAKLPPGRDILGSGVLAQATSLGLNECLTLGLRHLLIPDDTLELALVTNQRDYDLSTWAWLDRASRLVDVRTLDAVGTTYQSTPHTWEFREGARGATLHVRQPFRFSSGSYTAKLDVLRPADTLIKVGGATWTEGATGPTDDDDEVGVELTPWLTIGKVFAYMALRDRAKGMTAAKYDALYRDQLAEARKLRYYDRTNDIDPLVPDGAPSAVAAEAA